MTEHATPNTTRPAADLFEIIRTTRSMRRVKSAGVPKWGRHPPTATHTTRWPVTPRGLGRGTDLLGENPGARRRSRRNADGRPPQQQPARARRFRIPRCPGLLGENPGQPGGGCENWKSEAKHKDAFLTPAGRHGDLKKLKLACDGANWPSGGRARLTTEMGAWWTPGPRRRAVTPPTTGAFRPDSHKPTHRLAGPLLR